MVGDQQPIIEQKEQLNLNVSMYFKGEQPKTWEGFGQQIQDMAVFIDSRTNSTFSSFRNEGKIKQIITAVEGLKSFDVNLFKPYAIQLVESKVQVYINCLQAVLSAEQLERKNVSGYDNLVDDADFKVIESELSDINRILELAATHNK